MNKIDNIIIKYCVYSIPLLVGLGIWGSTGNPEELSMATGLQGILWNFLGWIAMTWVVSAAYLSCKTLFKSDFREIVLKKISGIKERDEREVQITGSAAKYTFFSTSALVIFLLLLSMFTIKIGKYPADVAKEGKNGFISIGINFYPIENPKPKVRICNSTSATFKGYPNNRATNIACHIV